MSAVNEIINASMNNPEVLIVGAAAGFAASKFMNMRRNSGMGGGMNF